MSYNGWANYETWVTALWIDNEEGSYRARKELARDFVSIDGDDEPTNDVEGYAVALKEWVEETYLPDLGPSLAADLLNAALGEVDWREMAEHFLDE